MYKIVLSVAATGIGMLNSAFDGALFTHLKESLVELIVLGKLPFINLSISFDMLFIPFVMAALYIAIKSIYPRGKQMSQQLVDQPDEIEKFRLISI